MTKYSFSNEFQKAKYEACLEEIGTAIDKFRGECKCSEKFLMSVVHIGHSKLKKGVCKDKWLTSFTTSV